MAKKTNNDLLGEILETLNEVIENQGKSKSNSKSADKDKGSKGTSSGFSEIFNATKEANKNEKGSAKGGAEALNTIKSLVEAVKISKSIKQKDVDHVKNIVLTLSNTLKEIKFEKELVDSFKLFTETLKLLNDMMQSLNGNLLKTIWKYNKTRGKMLGKSLARFYVGLFEGFQKEGVFTKAQKASKKSVDSLLGITNVIKSLFEMSSKQFLKMGIALRVFPKKSMEKMASLFKTLIKIVNDNRLKDDDYKTKIKNFEKLMVAFSKVPIGALFLMGLMLNPKHGKKIGKYFKSLINSINEVKEKDLKNASNIIKAITFLIVGLTVSLLIVILIAKTFKAKHILGGFVILTALILFALGIIWVLNKITASGKSIGKKNLGGDIKYAILMVGAIALLLLTLSLCLLITTSISKNHKGKDIAIGLGVLAILVLFSLGIIWVLSNDRLREKGKDALMMAGALILIGLALLLLCAVFKMAGKDPGKVTLGGIIMMAVLLGMIGLTKLASKINMKDALKGIAAVGAMALLVMLVAGAVAVYALLMDSLADLSWEDLGEGSAKVALVLAGFLAIVTGLGLILMIPGALAVLLAGAIALAALGGLIMEISGAIMVYNAMIRDVLSIKAEDMKTAESRIVGKDGMVSSITKIVEGLSAIGVIAAIKAHIIADNLSPLFDTLSKFMKIIEKMANLRYIEKYDDKGNPVYGKLPDDVFISASKTLALGFADFINILGSAFDGKSDNIAMVKMICEQLTPSVLKRVFGGAPSVNDLLDSLGKFVKIVEKMANLKFIDYYDDNGNPVYKSYDPTLFETAAETLVNGFKYFLDTIYNGFKDSSDDIESIIDDIADGDTMKLMTCLSNFVDAIDKMANLKFVTGYDDKGNPIFATYGGEGLDPNVLFLTAAGVLASGFSAFLKKLHTELKNCSGDIEDIIDDIGDGDTLDMFNALSAFTDAVVKYGESKRPIAWDENGKPIEWEKIDIVDSGNKIAMAFTSFLKTLHTQLSGKEDEIEDIIDVIGGNKGIITVFDAVKKFLEPCIQIAQGKVNDKDITLEEITSTSTGLANMLADFIEAIPPADSIEDFPDSMKYLNKGVSTYLDVLEDMADIATEDYDGYNIIEVGHLMLSTAAYTKATVNTLNKTDFKKFRNNMKHLEVSTRYILKTLKRLKKTAKFNSEEFLNSLKKIKAGVDNFLSSFQKHYQLRIDTLIDKFDPALEEQIIQYAGEKTIKFTEVEEKIKAVNVLMQELVRLEKEWTKLSLNSVFNKLSETLKKQAESLRTAIDDFKNAATSGDAQLLINPASIAEGINQSSFELRRVSSTGNFIK